MKRPGAPTESKVFCVVPWTHMYLQQDGSVFPCCNADPTLPIGELRRSALREIWNGPEYRALRRQNRHSGGSRRARGLTETVLSNFPHVGFWALNSLPTKRS